MYKLKLYKKAKNELDILKKKNSKYLKNIIDSLDEISKNGLNISNIKNIWDNIYRKRTWRYRILLTIDNYTKNLIHIWIIDIEKNTKKDYKKRKSYIMKYKLYFGDK